jgi:hypothetical protein
MLKRLLLGLVLGCLVGGLAAAAMVKGLGWPTFTDAGGMVVAYLAALVTGAVTGLVAGKPIWARGAQIEALLKAFFGALLGAAAMFALRKWAAIPLDLPLSLGAGPIYELPAAALPAIGGVLGAFYGLDNTDSPEPAQERPSRVAAGADRSARVRADSGQAPEADDASDAENRPARKKR